jgi:hypothetical protein
MAGYLEVDGVYLNTFLHATVALILCILFIGAFASLRHNSYRPWIRRALYLPEVASLVVSAAAVQWRYGK